MVPMNIEHTDFQEIPAIDITCKNCNSVIRLTLPKDRLTMNLACVGCNTQLWGYEDDEYYLNVLGFLKLLSRYRGHIKESKFTIGFALPFGVRVSSGKG